ncbi:NAD(P)H-hydrate epimerase [Candidatus Kryptobacter tengchongensis]|uniref:Bifunctional NAD(P)H-hydrate repair enzyme n=1 Tax=Kryptobacter tengchongensis TaxID=1643429 RepID=A0A656DE07_KRYT1|nr:bifunctional ADP-dependent NAD(P)H-hydrate dehydratase/NAD(P)H-hydrate epimerase [Candidatus Kryptobacter tengchongensis]CUS78371.1 NAD(P)H-hydrate epimerase [Candidatus Kryptobacter tengchongensis]CUS99579.1 NAD(P)H-hydrate epimerase [Candidatus Kryptobacter tengchongensis]CUT02826.1 NAD(P)H-hydrate epimerase [Candidatus Kryptobacter tengchongensis]CUU01572.1 NAD(P)H-hydrate epimerase [Candidatus Kryptobacter tengchongensis]CUU07449.1 NAD(P)H-hydrate epimerase [Candidatus Kryptobacter teng
MLLVASPEEIRKCDSYAIEKLGIPGILLMENASQGVIQSILMKYGGVAGKKVFVFCGGGNNGGDGLAVARKLFGMRAEVYIFLLVAPEKLHGDTKTNYEIALKIQKDKPKTDTFEIITLKDVKELEKYPKPDLVIDAIFGTGFKGKVQGLFYDVINWINTVRAYTVSVDIPSGLNGDTGEVEGIAVRADLTATMGLAKTGLMLNMGKILPGKIYIIDIGIPSFVYQLMGIKTYYLESLDVKRRLPVRPFNVHKYSCGKIFALVGSPGLTGAATMSTLSAMKVGAGAVIAGVPESLSPILEMKLTEVMKLPLPETNEHTIGWNALDLIEEYIEWADVLIIGPGISKNYETKQVILNVIKKLNKKAVIDADGLNALVGNLNILKSLHNEIVLTPHSGEFSRLTDLPIEKIEREKIEVARNFAVEYGVVLVLKGDTTVIANPEGEVFINPTGNPGMATAGSGDVLTGMIAGFMGQGLSAVDASICGVYLHGLAGDIARDKLGELPMMAMDILNAIPDAIQKVIKEEKG